MAEEYLTKAGLAYFYSKLNLSNVANIKYDTVSGWNSKTTLISALNTVYIYTDYRTITDGQGHVQTVPGIKIGDGLSYLTNVPFLECEVSIDVPITQAEINTIFA